ncbi:MAG: ribonuclease III [Ahrensia sp.]|nr:ribonuclease III [Ahrensia sp.]
MATARISSTKIGDLERRIGHSFNSYERLLRALTHSSATARTDTASNYQRLEFLGDRVLGLCVAELLFETFPTSPEGELAVRSSALVSGRTCAEIADEIGLPEFIHAGTDVKHLSSKKMRSVRADVLEALIAAIYLDAGLEAARKFVARYWQKRLHRAGAGTPDSKTALQEWTHANFEATPVYSVAKRSGPDHEPVFTVEVSFKGGTGEQGVGRSKRAAEQQAAKRVLVREGVWESDEGGAS